MSTASAMGWEEAIMAVLQSAEEPLGAHEITRAISARKLRTLTGANPVNTVLGRLSTMTSNKSIMRTERGFYALPAIAQRVEEEATAEEIEAETAAADPTKLTVKAYGLHWDRNSVDWSATRGQLWGQQDENFRPVDFADQDGIYLLHSWNEVVYVGQTFTGKGPAGLYSRLRDHHTDRDRRKSDRWDTFSWFGFKPVDEQGNLLPAPPSAELASVIDVVEAMFIEALMPRLNMQAGRGFKKLRETGLYFQISFQKSGRGFR